MLAGGWFRFGFNVTKNSERQETFIIVNVVKYFIANNNYSAHFCRTGIFTSVPICVLRNQLHFSSICAMTNNNIETLKIKITPSPSPSPSTSTSPTPSPSPSPSPSPTPSPSPSPSPSPTPLPSPSRTPTQTAIAIPLKIPTPTTALTPKPVPNSL